MKHERNLKLNWKKTLSFSWLDTLSFVVSKQLFQNGGNNWRTKCVVSFERINQVERSNEDNDNRWPSWRMIMSSELHFLIIEKNLYYQCLKIPNFRNLSPEINRNTTRTADGERNTVLECPKFKFGNTEARWSDNLFVESTEIDLKVEN